MRQTGLAHTVPPQGEAAPGLAPTHGTTLAFTVDAAQAGERVDRFLSNCPGAPSRSRIKGLIEGGNLLCNGVVLREPATPVRAGMVVVLDLPAAAPATPQGEAWILTSCTKMTT